MTLEDKAFDEIARKQRHSGGGFQAKRAAAADKDALFEKFELAQPAQEPVAHLWECLGRWSAYLVCNGKQAECSPPSWLVEAIQNATTPPKREWVKLTYEEIEELFQSAAGADEETVIRFARLIESKIKEKNT